MTLRQFLDTAYALLVEEFQRLGSDLMSATETLSQWAARDRDEPVVEAVERQNEAALQQLNKMMAGL